MRVSPIQINTHRFRIDIIAVTPNAKRAPSVSAARTASAAIKPMAQPGNAKESAFDVASASERRFVEETGEEEEATFVETDKTDATKVTNIEVPSSNGK